jgi:hypothetical protein
MSSSNLKLRAAGAFAVIAGLALAVSCQGFFPKATLQSIALQPQTPSFGVGYQQPMQAWGTDSNSNRYQLTSGVSWQVTDPSSGVVATIDPNTGTMTGVNPGTLTVNASAQGLTGSTTGTVVELVTAMTISPTSTSVEDTGTAYAQFTIKDGNGNDISSLVTLTAELGGQSQSTIVPCGFEIGLAGDGTQDCMPEEGQVTQTTVFTIVVSYSGYTGAPVSASLTVTPDQ